MGSHPTEGREVSSQNVWRRQNREDGNACATALGYGTVTVLGLIKLDESVWLLLLLYCAVGTLNGPDMVV